MLLVDDIRNTGETFARWAALVKDAGGTVLATAQICDRCEATVDLGVPNIALVDYPAPENYKADLRVRLNKLLARTTEPGR